MSQTLKKTKNKYGWENAWLVLLHTVIKTQKEFLYFFRQTDLEHLHLLQDQLLCLQVVSWQDNDFLDSPTI